MSTIDNIRARLAELLDGAEGFSASVLFDFGHAGVVHIDGGAGPIRLSDAVAPADCTIVMPSETFARILKGELDETAAFMQGEMQIKGEVGLAATISDFLRSQAQG